MQKTIAGASKKLTSRYHRTRMRLLLVMLVMLIPLSLWLAGIFLARYHMRRQAALQENLAGARTTANAFEAYVRDVLHHELIVGNTLVTEGLYRSALANRLLGISARQNPTFRNLNWVLPQGYVIASSVPSAIGTTLDDRDYFRQLQAGREWVISDLLPAGRISEALSIVIAHRLRDERGRVRGMMVAEIDPDMLDVIWRQITRPADGLSAIFDHRGRLVYSHPPLARIWEERTNWLQSDPLLQRTLREGVDTTGVMTPAGGNREPWFAARMPIADTGYVAGASRPAASLLSSLRAGLLRSFLLLLLLDLVAFAVAFGIAESVVGPLRRLQEDAHIFGRGQYHHRAAVAGPPEIQQVAERFNALAGEIDHFHATLEERIRQRTVDLDAALGEMKDFSYTAAEKLRPPAHDLDEFSAYLLDRYVDRLDKRGRDFLEYIRDAAQRMDRLTDDLLQLARVEREPLQMERIDLSELATTVIGELRQRDPTRQVTVEIAPAMIAQGDRQLLVIALAHLLDNAWKFTGKREDARITMGMRMLDSEHVFTVQDNGAGFDMEDAGKLFTPFQRLHPQEEFPGTGLGLAIVQRILTRHGGRIWAESKKDEGATFYFTLVEAQDHNFAT